MYWLGLNRDVDSGGWSTWSWESGGPFGYNKWATLEPGDTYDCTRIGATNDYWAEDDCEAQLGCICDRPRLGAKVLSTSVLRYSSTDFAVLVGTQYSYFQKVLVLVLVLKYF